MFKVGDKVLWLTYKYAEDIGVGKVLGITEDTLHVRFSRFRYSDHRGSWQGDFYSGLDYHTPAIKDCVPAYNGLQLAIQKAKT